MVKLSLKLQENNDENKKSTLKKIKKNNSTFQLTDGLPVYNLNINVNKFINYSLSSKNNYKIEM